jgi:hypothetical protein
MKSIISRTLLLTAVLAACSGGDDIVLPNDLPVASIEILGGSLQSVWEGETAGLSSKILNTRGEPSGKWPTWTSSDITVATVTGIPNGNLAQVKALKPGTTRITATSESVRAEIVLEVMTVQQMYMFYTTDANQVPITVSLNGQPVGQITTPYVSEPVCGTFGTVSIRRPAGVYTFTARSDRTGRTWTSIPIQFENKKGCNRVIVN